MVCRIRPTVLWLHSNWGESLRRSSPLHRHTHTITVHEIFLAGADLCSPLGGDMRTLWVTGPTQWVHSSYSRMKLWGLLLLLWGQLMVSVKGKPHLHLLFSGWLLCNFFILYCNSRSAVYNVRCMDGKCFIGLKVRDTNMIFKTRECAGPKRAEIV